MAKIDVVMPKMGESIMEGTVLSWLKQPGDAIELDETLLEIATDKVDSEIPSPAAGVLAEILVPEGDTVDVGTLIARIETDATADISAPAETAPAAPAPVAPSGDGASSAPAPVAVAKAVGNDGRSFSPLVRSIASEEGISQAELETVPGSGKDGRVTKDDLLAYVKNRGGAPVAAPVAPVAAAPARMAPPPVAAGNRVEIIEMDRMRQIIADHMTRSKSTSAHVTSFAEVDVTNLVKLRERNKAAFLKREGVKLTYTPFFVQAAVDALREHPILNSSVDGKRILVKKDFHIGIAVAIGTSGLVVPVVKNAGAQNVIGLAHSVADLAHRTRAKQLTPDELTGGTFTVTNVGSLGSIMGTPIISQPQVAILATGAIKKRPMVIEDPVLGDVIAIRHMMYFSLSYDHRIVDGAMSASYLGLLQRILENIDPNQDI